MHNSSSHAIYIKIIFHVFLILFYLVNIIDFTFVNILKSQQKIFSLIYLQVLLSLCVTLGYEEFS